MTGDRRPLKSYAREMDSGAIKQQSNSASHPGGALVAWRGNPCYSHQRVGSLPRCYVQVRYRQCVVSMKRRVSRHVIKQIRLAAKGVLDRLDMPTFGSTVVSSQPAHLCPALVSLMLRGAAPFGHQPVSGRPSGAIGAPGATLPHVGRCLPAGVQLVAEQRQLSGGSAAEVKEVTAEGDE